MRIDMQYILGASPEQVREITLMALFNSAFELWAAEHEKHSFYLPMQSIHKHVQTFISGLGLVMPSFNPDESGKSPAVERFINSTRDFPIQDGEIMGWTIVTYKFPIKAILSRCEVYARLAEVDLDQMRKAFEDFIAEAKHAARASAATT